MKKVLFKNTLYIFFAFCLAFAGLMALTFKTEHLSYAESAETSSIDNSQTPDFVLVKQSLGDVETSSGTLKDFKTFSYYTETGSSSSLELSFALNGETVNANSNELYHYVYYPDPSQISQFQFYHINNVTLTINGANETLGSDTVSGTYHFANLSSLDAHQFQLILNDTGSNNGKNNAVKILNEDGSVREGLYTLSFDMVLVTCDDGGTTMSEEGFHQTSMKFSSSFVVTTRSAYVNASNIPQIENKHFDQVASPASTADQMGYYLQSSYISNGDANKIPYITYDYTRYELAVQKTLGEAVSSETFEANIDTVDMEETPILTSGNNIVHLTFDKAKHNARVYFSDIGTYNLSLNAIQIVKNEDGSIQKFNLDEISSIARKIEVDMFGYEFGHTDYDQAADSNNNRPVEVMRSTNFDGDEGVFVDTADVTSAFINSRESYDPEEYGVTFTRYNIIQFLNTQRENKYVYTPVVTNQTPIKVTTNAKQNDSEVRSLILSTNNIGTAEQNSFLQGKRMFYAPFTGQTLTEDGTYIYIIFYTYDGYRTATAGFSASTMFCQIFFFEINKGNPDILVQTQATETEQARSIDAGDFTNKSVVLTNTTLDDPYTKDVIIRIYAWDYSNNQYLSTYGGTSGRSMSDIANNARTWTLSENALYTIRLYYANEVKSDNDFLISNEKPNGFISERSFTIDKTPITASDIIGRNVSEDAINSRYYIQNRMDSFATNQSMTVSWNEKASNAATWGFYRYFELRDGNYYSSNQPNITSVLTPLLTQHNMIAVNSILDMSCTSKNGWTSLSGNTLNIRDGEAIAGKYVFSDAGLYLVDIYDQAGNHAVKVFLIDRTSPLFVLDEGNTKSDYVFPSSTHRINTTSMLYWGKYKGIFMANFTSSLYTSSDSSAENIPEGIKGEQFYLDHDGNVCEDIFKAMYTQLYGTHMQHFTISAPVDKSGNVDSAISEYTSMYLTIAINSSSLQQQDENSPALEVKDQTSKEIVVESKEYNFTIYIRDLSNTKTVATSGSDTFANANYTNYYSARQIIKVSFDSSQLRVTYEKNSGEVEEFLTSTSSEDEATDAKTEFLAPTSMKKPFSISFVPTTQDGAKTIQVKTVSVEYTPYIPGSVVANGITYYHMVLDVENSETTEIFNSTRNTEQENFSQPLNVSSGITAPGRYVITRIYETGDSYSIDERDFQTRTFVLYVDRNEVVSSLEGTEGGNSESLVGGDIFVSMFDDSNESSIVVTFPDSETGNKDNQGLYNNWTSMADVQTGLYTNKVPVKLYIPQFKYTTHVTKEVVDGHYNFHAHYDFQADGQSKDFMNKFENDVNIQEYTLFAELYKDGTTASNIIATTSSNSANPTLENLTAENGFLVFYRVGTNQPLESLTESGEYYVNIHQGYFGKEGTASENSFHQTLTFKFEITSVIPEFTVRGEDGNTLNSESVSGQSVSQIYHSNNSTALLTWNCAQDKYSVEVETIVLRAYNPISRTSTTYTTSKQTSGDSTVTWTTFDNGSNAADQIWKEVPNKQGSTYNAILDLKALPGVYTNEGYVDITMKFTNDEQLYQPTTKRLLVDLSAPNRTIGDLVSASLSGTISQMTETSLRRYLTYDGEVASSSNNTSFNVSANSGDFAYYSYSVNTQFLDTLFNNREHQTFVRKFVDANGNNTKYEDLSDLETDYDTFSNTDSRFTEISNLDELDVGSYYEVVETDMAGNLTIFTIYVAFDPQYDPATDPDTEHAEEYNQTAIFSYGTGKYTNQQFNQVKVAQSAGHPNAKHNIYSTTGFSLTDINFFGDEWAQINLTGESGIPITLMLSPFYKGSALLFIGNAPAETVSLSSLINGEVGSLRKNIISIYDRVNKTTEVFLVNILRTRLSSQTTDIQDSEYIRFSLVTDEQIESTTTASNYVTSMTITAGGVQYYNQNNPLGYASDWRNTTYVSVTQPSGFLQFTLSSALNLDPNTRVLYEFSDNYGTTYQEIHLFKEAVISKEVNSTSDLYSYLDADSGMVYYITESDFQFTYNPNKYEPFLYDANGREVEIESGWKTNNMDGTITLTIPAPDEAPYMVRYTLDIRAFNMPDISGFGKTINFVLYNQLAKQNTRPGSVNEKGEFKILDASGNDITDKIINNSDETGYFSEVRVTYNLDDEAFIPTKFMVSTDLVNWHEISSGERLRSQSDDIETMYLKIWYDEQYLRNYGGTPEYVFGNVPERAIHKFNLSSLTTYFWVELETESGTRIIQKDSRPFITSNGRQYTNHYMVNVDYDTNRDAVKIRLNNEQDMLAPEQIGEPIRQGSVASVIWRIASRTTSYSINIVITYLPPRDNIVQHFYTTNTSGMIDNTDLISSTEQTIVVSEQFQNVDRIQIYWTKYYGIVQNEISISLVKDGIDLAPTTYTTTISGEQYNYTYLTLSGRYTIQFRDVAGNVHKFKSGQAGESEIFTFTFLKDVPFTVTHTNIDGEEETSIPLKQAVYNGSVTLNIDTQTRSQFYATSGYPQIHVTRNGVAYDGEWTRNDTKFEFTSTGYYEVYFEATSFNNENLRTETYQFTILNAHEHKISYVFNRYANYYVESVIRDGEDITQNLVELLDIETINMNGKECLTQLPISYLDEKTGVGEYVITINTNNTLYNGEALITSWTFRLTINRGTAPIRISVSEGKSTTKTITATFNRANIYAEMGECTLRVVRYSSNGSATIVGTPIRVTADSTGEASLRVTDEGTYYVQITSPSGILLFSYKVVKKAPMNAATIIIIVVSVVVLLVAIFLIVKLRKRISVK